MPQPDHPSDRPDVDACVEGQYAGVAAQFVPERVERLQAFFDCLNKVFVDCDKKDFVDTFQGKTNTDKILWIREIKELHYLIDHIEEWIKWPDSYDKWQMTCARFQIRVKAKDG